MATLSQSIHTILGGAQTLVTKAMFYESKMAVCLSMHLVCTSSYRLPNMSPRTAGR